MNRVIRHITEPTEEYPEGSECPIHKRQHDSHGWYVCVELVPKNTTTDQTVIPNNTRGRLLMAANTCVNKERNASYGDPIQDFRRTAAFWEIYLNGIIQKRGTLELLPHDVALMMTLLKTSRLVWNPESSDNWVDIAGYAACGYDCAHVIFELNDLPDVT